MARLAAQEKGEYYPTPLEVADAIANLIHVKPVRNKPIIRLFDPCAGEGLALARVAELLRKRQDLDVPVATWGVEINDRRAAEAATRLDQVVASPFEVAAWKPSRWGVASLLFLNPPYDFSASSSYKRMESYFLEKATPALESGGLLAFIVPPAAVNWQTLHFLWQWYDEIEAYRFPDDLFERFKQLVVFGKRRKVRDRRRYPAQDKPLTKMTRHVHNSDRLVAFIREQIPSLADRTEPLVVPTTRTKAALYRGGWSQAEMVAKVKADPAPVMMQAMTDLYGPQEDTVLESLLPPKQGHIAQALASGIMGTMAFPGEVIKGRAVKSRKLVEETQTVDAKGGVVVEERYRDEYDNHIALVTPEGLEYLSDTQVVVQFLKDNVDRLADVMMDRIRVYGNTMTPEEAAILARLSPDRYLPGREETGLLDNQKETAIAMARAIQRHGIGHLVGEMGYGVRPEAVGTNASHRLQSVAGL